MFAPDYSLLFAEDFPACRHPADATAEDLLFLNLPPDVSTEGMKNAFHNSKCFQWLFNLVKEHDSQEMYFGEMAASLHTVLLDDPKPYRKDIKQLLSNLLGWIDALDIDDLRVDRPSHSQRLRYINREI